MRRSILVPLCFAIACTSLDAREPDRTKNADDGTVVDTKTTPDGKPNPKPDPRTDPKPEPKPEPKPDPVAATVEIAIASVQLDQDCPDPATASPEQAPADEAPASPATMVAPKRSMAPGAAMPARPGESMGRRACPQSTMVVELTSRAAAEAKVEIVAIALRDVQSNATVGDVVARAPTKFEGSGYVAWNERIAAGAKLNASYKLRPPSWSNVATALGGGVDTRDRPFELEVTFAIDGKPQTVRSTEFRRPPELIMPPT